MARLYSDVQDRRREVKREGSPLAGFIDRDKLCELASAIEDTDSAASSAPPLVMEIPRPVVG